MLFVRMIKELLKSKGNNIYVFNASAFCLCSAQRQIKLKLAMPLIKGVCSFVLLSEQLNVV